MIQEDFKSKEELYKGSVYADKQDVQIKFLLQYGYAKDCRAPRFSEKIQSWSHYRKT